jgi:hypothetical protein
MLSSLVSRFKFIDVRAESAIAVAAGSGQRDAVVDGRRDPDRSRALSESVYRASSSNRTGISRPRAERAPT